MSNIARFRTGKIPEYIKSVNTPEYSSDPDVIVNPDISALGLVPRKHWKRVGDTIVEMTQAEKDTLVATELQAKKDAITLSHDDMRVVLTALIKVVNLRLPSNKITKEEMIQAIKDEI